MGGGGGGGGLRKGASLRRDAFTGALYHTPTAQSVEREVAVLTVSVYVQRCQKGWWVYVCVTSTEARTVSRLSCVSVFSD